MGRTRRRTARFNVTVRSTFSGAHRLRLPSGRWEPLHGHNWRVEVVVRAPGLDRADLALDFLDLQRWVRQALGRLEHRYLNELPAFARHNPSAERIAMVIAETLATPLAATRCRVASVSVWETDETCATYYPA